MAERVGRTLCGRGVPPEVIDDALQTAALQALSRSQHFDTFQGLVRWATVVAWHEVIAEWRRQSRVRPEADMEDPKRSDPAELVDARLQLGTVADGLAALSDGERDAILSSLADTTPSDGPEEARTKMRRYRARRHLAALVSGGTVPIRSDPAGFDG